MHLILKTVHVETVFFSKPTGMIFSIYVSTDDSPFLEDYANKHSSILFLAIESWESMNDKSAPNSDKIRYSIVFFSKFEFWIHRFSTPKQLRI